MLMNHRYARLALAASLALVLNVPAAAQTISGIGTRDCQAYNRALELNSEAAIDAYLAWAQGYLSGTNASGAGFDIQVDHGGLLHALASFCGANPRARIYEALGELVDAYR